MHHTKLTVILALIILSLLLLYDKTHGLGQLIHQLLQLCLELRRHRDEGKLAALACDVMV